jgi:transposase
MEVKMEGVFMSKKQQFEFQILTDFLNSKLKRKEAAQLLEVRERTISRKARKIEERGLLGVVHSNQGKTPKNKICKDYKQSITTLIKKQYFDFNILHCHEKLIEKHSFDLSYSTLRRWFTELHLVKNRNRRTSKVRVYRDRMASEGLILQMDGCHHKFNGRDEWCLITAIDDATSEIPYAEFFHSEDTLNCMKVIQKIIEKKGLPYAIYTDRAGWSGGQKRQLFSQFKRACEDLGIRLLFANSPQAKGRIERAFRTIQDRLIPEMRIRKIKRMPTANCFLQDQFIPNYWNKRLTVTPRDLKTSYKTLPSDYNLNEIFCLKEYRTVNYDHTFSYESKKFLITTKLNFPIWKQQVEIRTYQDLKQKTLYANKVLRIREITKPIKNIEEKLQLAA